MGASRPTPARLQSNDTNSEALFCHCVPPWCRRSVSTAVVLRFVYGAKRSTIRSAAGGSNGSMDRAWSRPFSDNGIENNSLGLTILLQSRGGSYIWGHMAFPCGNEDDHQDVRVACNSGGPPNSYR